MSDDDEPDIYPEQEPKNILWVETYYDCIIPDEDNRNSNIIWETDLKKLPFMNIFLQFQFQRITDKKIRLTCVRIIPPSTDIEHDDGYTIQLQCSIHILNDVYSIIFDMFGKRSIHFDTFHLKRHYKYQSFDSKILVKMVEYDALPSHVFLRQEQKFQEMKLQYFINDSMLRDFYYILQTSMDQSMFTGRQDFEFASLKRNYIKRTAMFSAEICNCLIARDGRIPFTIALPLILNYILIGEQANITEENLIKAYLQAHRMGLKYFAYLSRDCILGHIRNGKMLVEAMYAADCVNDEFLFYRAAKAFISSNVCENLSRLLEDSNVNCRFVIKSLSRFLKQELHQHAVEETSLSEFF